MINTCFADYNDDILYPHLLKDSQAQGCIFSDSCDHSVRLEILKEIALRLDHATPWRNHIVQFNLSDIVDPEERTQAVLALYRYGRTAELDGAFIKRRPAFASQHSDFAYLYELGARAYTYQSLSSELMDFLDHHIEDLRPLIQYYELSDWYTAYTKITDNLMESYAKSAATVFYKLSPAHADGAWSVFSTIEGQIFTEFDQQVFTQWLRFLDTHALTPIASIEIPQNALDPVV